MRATAVFLCATLLAGCSLIKPPTVQPPAAAAAAAEPAPPAPTARELTPASDPALAAELAEMIKVDQELRRRWVKDQNSPALQEEMRQLSVKQVARMNEIIAASHGWPPLKLVGFNGMGAVWTISQHGGPEFLGRMLPLMYEAVKSGDLDEALYATSLDRVLTQQGKKQMYGTQFDVDVATGKCQPQPIEDVEHVDERRLRAKMDTLADYTKELCDLYLQRK
jgi:hypothetical protein